MSLVDIARLLLAKNLLFLKNPVGKNYG